MADGFSYDPTTPTGQVRLLAIDFDAASAVFSDAEIQAFMDLNAGVVRMAAAQALDVIAANEAFVSKKMMVDGDSFDGPAVAGAIRAQAAELRRQVREGDDASWGASFDFAEMVVDPFSYRDRLVNEMLRTST